MASWSTQNTTTGFNAQESANNTMSNRSNSRTRSNATNYDIGGLSFNIDARQYSIVGMSVKDVPKMRDAIRNYVSKIEAFLDGIDPLADANNAFKSKEVQESVRKYIDTVKSYCINLTSQLLAFSDKLAAVANAWITASSNIAGNVNSANSSFDAGTKYSDDKQVADTSSVIGSSSSN